MSYIPRRKAAGSSPRARGAQLACRLPSCRVGIIPACAGSTMQGRPQGHTGGDHPRVRGEHRDPPPEVAGVGGSSPRARGAQEAHQPADPARGIIPACAGSTLVENTSQLRIGDHPRVRGEHSAPPCPRAGQQGSSPRARGAHGRALHPPAERGIIPACAGSTFPRAAWTPCPRDHPRVRGEHPCSTRGHFCAPGSSPRARGAHRHGLAHHPGGGIIPACAGSTAFCSGWRTSTGDHPRVRGEHVTLGARIRCGYGSSPRARGAR